jgi:gluconokinase
LSHRLGDREEPDWLVDIGVVNNPETPNLGLATRIVVMGVAGCGKTSVASAIARSLDARFIDGDDLHLETSVAKMTAGIPLTDADRWPWLDRLTHELRSDLRVVVACSALKRSYRNVLRAAGDVRFLFLEVSEAEACTRTGNRAGHFMSTAMVGSQFAALERPGHDEADVLVIPANGPTDEVIKAALEAVATDRSSAQKAAADEEEAGHPETLIVVHPKERRSKCTILPLRGKPGLRFARSTSVRATGFVDHYVRLDVDGPELTIGDQHRGLLLLDGTWRWAEDLAGSFGHLETRSIKGVHTAYPRGATDLRLPLGGLATVEALYAAYRILRRPTEGLLDDYYWAEAFRRLNGWQ